MKMKLGDFAEAISTRVWERIGQANWRSFEDARTFVHSLGLKSGAEWWDYARSGKKPADIPGAADDVYANDGWTGMADWLGTQVSPYHRKIHRPFEEARAFAQGLGLKTEHEWRAYAKSAQKPDDIPANPRSKYAKVGWSGWGDWLGTGTIATHQRDHRSFKKARAFTHSLGLKTNGEWATFSKSGKKPPDIPAVPDRAYRKEGWLSWGDWLGTRAVATYQRQYRSFNSARARSLAD